MTCSATICVHWTERGQHAAAGYSSERLRLWNADGRQVMDGLQSVAIFG